MLVHQNSPFTFAQSHAPAKPQKPHSKPLTRVPGEDLGKTNRPLQILLKPLDLQGSADPRFNGKRLQRRCSQVQFAHCLLALLSSAAPNILSGAAVTTRAIASSFSSYSASICAFSCLVLTKQLFCTCIQGVRCSPRQISSRAVHGTIGSPSRGNTQSLKSVWALLRKSICVVRRKLRSTSPMGGSKLLKLASPNRRGLGWCCRLDLESGLLDWDDHAIR